MFQAEFCNKRRRQAFRLNDGLGLVRLLGRRRSIAININTPPNHHIKRETPIEPIVLRIRLAIKLENAREK